ncbi:hypothetical protein [Jatrophihabitans fulvus]
MATTRDAVVAAALAGAAGGCRTFTGIAALAAATPPDPAELPDRVLAHPATKAVLGLAALGEYVGDKLPQAPSRLQVPGLAGRLAFGAVSGLVAARRRPYVEPSGPPGEPVAPGPVTDGRVRDAVCVVVATAAAGAAAWLGARARGAAAPRLGRDWPVAVVEDAVAIGLATRAGALVS